MLSRAVFLFLIVHFRRLIIFFSLVGLKEVFVELILALKDLIISKKNIRAVCGNFVRVKIGCDAYRALTFA
jgi:hypothetical protein